MILDEQMRTAIWTDKINSLGSVWAFNIDDASKNEVRFTRTQNLSIINSASGGGNLVTVARSHDATDADNFTIGLRRTAQIEVEESSIEIRDGNSYLRGDPSGWWDVSLAFPFKTRTGNACVVTLDVHGQPRISALLG